MIAIKNYNIVNLLVNIGRSDSIHRRVDFNPFFEGQLYTLFKNVCDVKFETDDENGISLYKCGTIVLPDYLYFVLLLELINKGYINANTN